MAEIGAAWVSILPETKGFGKSFNKQVGGDLGKSGKRMGASFGKVFAAAAAIGIGAKAFGFLKGSLAEAREAEIVGARTDNVIKKMGASAWTSSKQVGALASSLSNKVGVDDEAIQAGQNLLLTFGAVRNEAGRGNKIFDQTSALMVDMSVAMGQDMKSSAIQLGKALNDPVKGVSALSRVGVSFTAQQKEQIKTLAESGHVLDAQKIILGEVKKQFGGAAKAMTTPAARAQVAFGNLKEQIGTALLPVVDRLATMMTNKVIPAVSRFVTQMQTGTGFGGKVVATIKSLGTAVATTVGFLKEHKNVVIGLTAATVALVAITKAHAAVMAVQAAGGLLKYMASIRIVTMLTKTWAAVQWAMNAALTANPIGLAIAAIAALVAGVVIAYKRSDTFRAIVQAAFQAVKVATAGVITFLAKVPAAFRQIVNGAGQVLGWVKGNWPKIVAFLAGPIGIAVLVITKNWDRITAGARRVYDGVRDALGKMLGFIRGLPGKIVGALGDLSTLLLEPGRRLIGGLISGITEKAKDLGGAMKGIAGKIKGFLPGSPVKEGPLRSWNRGGAGKRLMQMLIDGINAHTGKVGKAAESVADRIDQAFKKKRIGKALASRMREYAKDALGAASKLRDLIKAQRDMAGQVASNFRNEFDLSALTAPNEYGFSPSGATAVKAAQAVVARMKAFAAKIAGLVRAGIPGALIQEIAGMGSVEGSRVAGVLLGAGKADRGQLTKAFGDFNTYAQKIGNTVAGQQYGSSIAAQQKDLAHIEHAIERGLKHARFDVRLDVDKGSAVRIYHLGRRESERRK